MRISLAHTPIGWNPVTWLTLRARQAGKYGLVVSPRRNGKWFGELANLFHITLRSPFSKHAPAWAGERVGARAKIVGPKWGAGPPDTAHWHLSAPEQKVLGCSH